MTNENNFSMIHLDNAPRAELHDALSLTGCEASINRLAPNTGIPFVHSHKDNEELYGVLSGSGQLWLDGKLIEVRAGDWFRIAPSAKRSLLAGDEGLGYVCIQTKAGSLGGFTMTDGVMSDDKTPWM